MHTLYSIKCTPEVLNNARAPKPLNAHLKNLNTHTSIDVGLKTFTYQYLVTIILAPWSSDYSESSVQVIHLQVSHKLGERRREEGRTGERRGGEGRGGEKRGGDGRGEEGNRGFEERGGGGGGGEGRGGEGRGGRGGEGRGGERMIKLLIIACSNNRCNNRCSNLTTGVHH